MIKLKTTKKSIKNNYYNILEIGYSDIQELLRYTEPFAYTCGIYGWNADIYEVTTEHDGIYNKIVICTGYRPFGNISVKYDTLRKYEEQARFINSWECKLSQDEKKQKIKKLLQSFINEVLEQEKKVG